MVVVTDHTFVTECHWNIIKALRYHCLPTILVADFTGLLVDAIAVSDLSTAESFWMYTKCDSIEYTNRLQKFYVKAANIKSSCSMKILSFEGAYSVTKHHL